MQALLVAFYKPSNASQTKSDRIEEALIDGLRAGNQNTVKELYRMYAPSLYGIIKRIVKFDEIAEDILQDAFVKIWKCIQQYDSSKGRLFTWMANLSKNLAIDHVRSKTASNTAKTCDLFALSTELIDRHVHIQVNVDTIGIKKLLNSLTIDQQCVIELIYLKGYTHVQVSELLAIPLGTVKTKLRLGMLTLRKKFGIDI